MKLAQLNGSRRRTLASPVEFQDRMREAIGFCCRDL
jgi:hypothetical protein